MIFSVVIPVFNRTSTLKTAIESVLAQTFRDFEIIVVDDGSCDSVKKCLKPYMGLIRYIRNDKNQGVSHARNTGIKSASGEYIAFLDSDDIWLPDKLKAQNQALQSTGLKVSHTKEHWFRAGRFVNQGKKHQRYGGFIFDKILDTCRISPSSVVIHTSVFENCGLFNKHMRTCEDYDLWLRICSKYEVNYLPVRYVIKRAITDDQLSDSIRHIEYIRLVSLARFLKHHPISPSGKLACIQELSKKFDMIKYGINNF